ncbi:unnamed protein product, partial [Ectocarpus fasciculatus]
MGNQASDNATHGPEDAPPVEDLIPAGESPDRSSYHMRSGDRARAAEASPEGIGSSGRGMATGNSAHAASNSLAGSAFPYDATTASDDRIGNTGGGCRDAGRGGGSQSHGWLSAG